MSDSPALTLSPTAQKIYQNASADPSVGPSLALASAQEYDRKKAEHQANIEKLTQQQAGFKAEGDKLGNGTVSGALGYTLFNPESDANLAKLAPIAAIPFTGGLSLLGSSALVGGAAAAGEIARQTGNIAGGGTDTEGNKESFSPLNVAENGLGNAALNFAGGKALEAVGGAARSLVGWAGSQAEKLAVGSLGVKPAQSGAFWQQTGQKLGDFLAENGLVGRTADDVTSLKNAAQESYDAIARKSGIQVPVSNLTSAVEDSVKPLLDGVSSQSHETAQAILDEYQKVLTRFGIDPADTAATIDIGKLADAKSEFQRQVRWNNPDHVNTTNGSLADAFLKTVNDAAGEMTDAAGNKLSQIGQKLRGLNLLEGWAQKAANTTAPGKVFTIGNMLRPAAGALAGGVAGPVGAGIGAVGGLLGDVIANSPGAVRATAGLYGKGAEALGSLGNALSSNGAQTAARAAAVTGGNLLAGGGGQPASLPGNPASSVPSSPSLSSPATSGSTSGISRQQYADLLRQDLMTTGGRFSQQITAAFNAQNPDNQQGIATATNALSTLTDLYNAAGGAKGGLRGGLESVLGDYSLGLADQPVKAYNDQAQAIGQEIISQLYGSGGTSSERDNIQKNIPKVTDSKEVAASKLATLKALLQGRVGSNQDATSSTVTGQLSSPSLNLNR